MQKSLLLPLVFISLFISGCTIYSENSLPDLYPHKGKTILVLQGVKPSGMSGAKWIELRNEVEKRISKNPWTGKIREYEVQKSTWKENQQLRLDQEQFKTSLALAGITEKSLAEKLSTGHGVDQVLLHQFISYPCTEECTSSETWLMRVQLIDLSNGIQIHRLRSIYKPDDDELDGLPREEAALSLTRDLLERFNDSFVVPWHRLRYENIKSLGSESI